METGKNCILFFLLVLMCSVAFSQSDSAVRQENDYLTLQTGFVADGYNSLGIRTFFEYQKHVRNNWLFGISYEHSRHFGFFMTDQRYELRTNLSQLCVNTYYKLGIFKDQLFWTAGLGIGALHVNWDDNDRLGATINASLSLNVKITKRIYLETAPLFVLFPSNRIYYSAKDIDHFDRFYAFTFFPLGLKVKL